MAELQKSDLIEMLQHAAELEHALCVQYLYAAFSLKVGGDPQLSASQASLTQQWDQQITRIAVQEMYHLMLANNLLIAVGTQPHLQRPNFPQPAGHYSQINLPSMLASFDAQTATRFMCWEQPERLPSGTPPGGQATPWWVDFCRQCGTQAHESLGLEPADEPPYNSIGELYTIIQQALQAHPGWIDTDRASLQVTSELIPFKPTVEPITTFDDARRYIQEIIIEGEGTPDWQSTSHFAYFHQIVNQLGLTAPFEAAWRTVPNPVYDADNRRPGASFIVDSPAQPVGVLFNDLYLLFVRLLLGVFTAREAQRAPLANVVLALMPLAIKPLGTLLTRLPAGADYGDQCAGPSFELPQSATGIEALTTGAADALLSVVRRCRILSVDGADGLGHSERAQLAAVAARLETLLPMLDSMSTPAEVK